MASVDPRLASPLLLVLAAPGGPKSVRPPSLGRPWCSRLSTMATKMSRRLWASAMCSICRSKPRLLRRGIRPTARFREPPRTRQGDDTTQKG